MLIGGYGRHVGLIYKTMSLVFCIVLGLSGMASSPTLSDTIEIVNSNSDTVPSPAQMDWHLENSTKTAQFFATLQGLDGGMMEAEDNPFENTDNTLESIWVWCRYYELTGDNAYLQNVLNAWNYSIANPAWLEDDSGKIYSSAWALAAEQRFRNAYNNWTYSWYANASMQFIVNKSAWEPSLLFNLTARKHIRGWAAGNMYEYALDVGNQTAKWLAVGYGNLTMQEVESNPNILAQEGWALAGGTSMWGIWKSSMQEFPNVTWMQMYGPYLRTEVTNPGVGAGRSQVGWEAWYAGGHLGIWDITGDDVYYLNYLNITNRQITADGDNDGGLPTNYGEPDDTDESWVTSYRAYMILDEFNKIPSGNPPQAADLQQVDLSVSGTDVMLSWLPSGDDGAGENDVFAYEIYYSTNTQSCGYGVLNFTRLDTVFAGSTGYYHVGAGSNLDNYIYHIATRDFQAWRNSSTVYGGKCSFSLTAGENLVSVPFRTSSSLVSSVFQMSSLETAWTYDSSDATNPWKPFSREKPFNDLRVVNETMGIWVRVSSPDVFAVAGIVPDSTIIQIKSGWNLIGFPSMMNSTVGNILNIISYDRVEAFDPSSPIYGLKPVADSYLMQPGEALWVHSLLDGAIQIQN
jgi:hypothetical protein